MLSAEDQLSILALLSKADSHMAPQEMNLLHDVGLRLGLSETQIDELIAHPKLSHQDLNELPEDEKFEHLYSIVQMMKIDKRVHKNEIQFCERIAIKLGFKPGVVADLSAYIFSDPKVTSDREVLRKIAKKNQLDSSGD